MSMGKESAENRLNICRLIWVPSLISLCITILRLIGELQHWSEKWFTTETLGIVPSGMSWLIGITWLAIPFGIYFAWKLVSAGYVPQSFGKAFAFVVLGLLIVIVGLFVLRQYVPLDFPPILIYIWGVMALAGGIQYFAWRELFKVSLTYALVARIPVVIVMILAMRGNWGTHYDFVGIGPAEQMPLLPRIVWLAIFPQLV